MSTSPKKDPARIVFITVFLGMVLGAFTHCVIEPPKSATKKNSRSTASSNNESNNTTSPSPTAPPPVTNPVGNPGRDFFGQTVLPNFQNNCIACHADPSTNPPLPGPLTIYSYDSMRAKLTNGSNSTDNELIRKVQNLIGHVGGNRCPNGVTDLICQNLTDWYAAEFPVVAPPPSPTPNPAVSGLTGMLSVVSSKGKATGYAADSSDTNKVVGVNFYLDGPSGAGILLNNSPVQANQSGFNGGYAGAHAFNFFIPILYRDGVSHQLYVYADDGTDEVQVQGSPYTFAAYTNTVEGYNYYVSTVQPLLQNRCASCHAINYDQHYGSLISPSPANGGSMTNNEMINMPSGNNMGVNHPGGNLCGSKDNSPCAELQLWWDLEFN